MTRIPIETPDERRRIVAIARIAGAATLALALLLSVPALARHGGYPQLITPPYKFDKPGETPAAPLWTPAAPRTEARAETVMSDGVTGASAAERDEPLGNIFTRRDDPLPRRPAMR